MADGASNIQANSHAEWLAHVQPTGLVVAASVLDDLVSAPTRQTAVDSAEVLEVLELQDSRAKEIGAYIRDPWLFVSEILGWEPDFVAGVEDGPAIPLEAETRLVEHGVTLRPDWIVLSKSRDISPDKWLLFVSLLEPGVGLDRRGTGGWEATPSQQMERLLRETGAPAGLIISSQTLRLITAPRGESSGWMDFSVQALTEVAGRPMLSGLKQLVGKWALYLAPQGQNLRDLIAESRKAQANVSKDLAAQVLGALHALLRGLTAATPQRISAMAADPERSEHLYEGLLTVLMRLVFLLYAEDRDLLPSSQSGPALELYENNYSVRGLLAKLEEDEARYPTNMGDRVGAWGRLLALFRLVYAGDPYGWIQPRGGKLFDPDAFPFLEARDRADAPAGVPRISDACVLEVLRSLMRLKGDRLSYRTLDVEQIGSVYETVMGFTVEPATGPSLAIKAGKKNHTPVFVDLDKLAATKSADRLKWLKANTDRDKFPAVIEAAIKAAISADDLAAAFEAGYGVVDERASPGKRIAPVGTPQLQPTDERRRSGSHYTPRSLTEPVVRHTLEPAFQRLGPDATADQVLELKVCDPAMGSGAFLVESCRQLGARLEAAWLRWPDSKPDIPPDEDVTLHARRLVSQRCLYGVDKNPMATDLARLSLWLATLARDHEFTFLDHALKSGDSLVGLTPGQIAAANWDQTKPGLPLFRQLVRERVAEAETARAEIQAAPDNTARVIQETRHQSLEARLSPIRMMGDAVLSAFFGEDKARARETARARVESYIGGLPARWEKLEAAANGLRACEHIITPFHWQIEFPEVFARDDGGFDAIVGNPPFLGGTRVTEVFGDRYAEWLANLNVGSNRRADLVAHFFRRAFSLVRNDGAVGLISTNTIAQGDTQEAGLRWIVQNDGSIYRCVRRLRWPGEAAVIVSVVFVLRGRSQESFIDGQTVRRISAWLTEGDLDTLPTKLAANAGLAFRGHEIGGRGFLFTADGDGGRGSTFDEMVEIVSSRKSSENMIKPYIGGEEVNTSSDHTGNRYVIDFGNLSEESCKTSYPELYNILLRQVKPERDKLLDKGGWSAKRAQAWWRFAQRADSMESAISRIENVIGICRVSPHMSFTLIPRNQVFSVDLRIIASDKIELLSCLQARSHELWARFFSSSMKDDLRYSPSDCFRNFPFAPDFGTNITLKRVGAEYHSFRSQLMMARTEGLTKTYNRFHARSETGADIVRLRALHHDMDVAVLRAYGWDDLADRAAPEFIEQDADEGRTPKTRLDWPAEFKDEVLARLLALNAERAAEEREAGLTAGEQDDDETGGEEDA